MTSIEMNSNTIEMNSDTIEMNSDTIEMNSDTIETNILKILMNKPDENISQNNIYEKLSEIYSQSNNKPNTRSKNKKLKKLLTNYIISIKDNNIISNIIEGTIFLKYDSLKYKNNKNKNDNKDQDYSVNDKDYNENDDKDYNEDYNEDCDEDYNKNYDDDDEDEDYDEDEEECDENEVVNNKQNNNFYDNFFDSLLLDVNKHRKFIKKYRDVNGATISHHVVRSPKYINLVNKLIYEGLFFPYKKDKLGFTPLHYCCETLKTDMILKYIETGCINTEKNLRYEIEDLDKKIEYTEITARNADFKTSFLTGLFFLLLLNMFIRGLLF